MDLFEILEKLHQNHKKGINFSIKQKPMQLKFTITSTNNEVIDVKLIDLKRMQVSLKDKFDEEISKEYLKLFTYFLYCDNVTFCKLVYKDDYLNKMLNYMILM